MIELRWTDPQQQLWTAEFSDDRKYRYHLTRTWDDTKPVLVFIMMNPSTASASKDDHTIRKCVGFGVRLGFGAIHVINLLAICSRDPRRIDGVSPDQVNFDRVVSTLRTLHAADKVICAWGCESTLKRLKYVAGASQWLDAVAKASPSTNFYCLGRTLGGTPRHPRMLAYASELRLYLAGDTL